MCLLCLDKLDPNDKFTTASEGGVHFCFGGGYKVFGGTKSSCKQQNKNKVRTKKSIIVSPNCRAESLNMFLLKIGFNDELNVCF